MHVLSVSCIAHECPCEAWARNMARFCNRIVVIDRGSNPKQKSPTRQCLELLQAEGLPIEFLEWRWLTFPIDPVIDPPPPSIKDHGWVWHDYILSWGIRRALKTGPAPDWIDCSDGDENPQFTRESLEAALAAVPPGWCAGKWIEGYVPTPNGQRRRLDEPLAGEGRRQVKQFLPWKYWADRGDRIWPYISCHRGRTESGHVPNWIDVGPTAHTTVRSREQCLLKFAQHVAGGNSNIIRTFDHVPSQEEAEWTALKYGAPDCERVDPNSPDPFAGIEIKYPEYQDAHHLEALACLCEVNLEEFRWERGEDDLVKKLCEYSFDHYFQRLFEIFPEAR